MLGKGRAWLLMTHFKDVLKKAHLIIPFIVTLPECALGHRPVSRGGLVEGALGTPSILTVLLRKF